MARTVRGWIPVLLLVAVIAAGCSRPGSEFVGKWVNTREARDTMEITRNGDAFLIAGHGNKIAATYKDGSLEVSGVMGSIRITYVKDTDTLLGPGLLGQSEYKRVK
jgi:hypothetical protein